MTDNPQAQPEPPKQPAEPIENIIAIQKGCNYIAPFTQLYINEYCNKEWINPRRLHAKKARQFFALAGEPFYKSEGGKEWFDIPEPYEAWHFIYAWTKNGWRRFLIWKSDRTLEFAYIFGYRNPDTNHGCGTWAVPMLEYLTVVK